MENNGNRETRFLLPVFIHNNWQQFLYFVFVSSYMFPDYDRAISFRLQADPTSKTDRTTVVSDSCDLHSDALCSFFIHDVFYIKSSKLFHDDVIVDRDMFDWYSSDVHYDSCQNEKVTDAKR
jgi:hypothetical protein